MGELIVMFYPDDFSSGEELKWIEKTTAAHPGSRPVPMLSTGSYNHARNILETSETYLAVLRSSDALLFAERRYIGGCEVGIEKRSILDILNHDTKVGILFIPKTDFEALCEFINGSGFDSAEVLTYVQIPDPEPEVAKATS